jgi:hypothetical protein
MNHKILKLVTATLSVVLFYNLFFGDIFDNAYDLNIVSYVIYSLLGIFLLERGNTSRPLIKQLSLLICLSCITVIITGSSYSITILILLSLGLFASLNFSSIKSMIFLPILGVINLSILPLLGIKNFVDELRELEIKKIKLNNFIIYIVPIFIILLFIMIFTNANPKFAELTHYITEPLENILNKTLSFFSIGKIFFLCLGCYFAVVIYYSKLRIQNNKISEPWELTINKKSKLKEEIINKEYKAFLATGVLMNILLLIVNIIDIRWVWLDSYIPVYELSNFVHEGTYTLCFALILCLLLSLLILRNELNFYKNGLLLKYIILGWNSQIIFLIFSVVVKNIHYINYYGLTGKRIGVFIFLSIILLINFVVVFKILKNKTTYYVVSKSMLIGTFLLVLISFFNWDSIIVSYNLENEYTAEKDFSYMLSLSGKSSYLLYKHKNNIPEKYHQRIDYKCNKFIDYYISKQPFSFNFSDYYAYKHLREMNFKAQEIYKY